MKNALFCLCLLLATSAALADTALEDFGSSSLPGRLDGSSWGPDRFGCEAGNLPATADSRGAGRLVSASEPPLPGNHGGMLRLDTTAADQSLAWTRWSYGFQTDQQTFLDMDLQFTSHDRRDFGDWYLVLLDGRAVTCGDTRSTPMWTPGDPATTARTSGWFALSDLVRVPVTPGEHLLEIAVGNGIDNRGASALYVDRLRLQTLLADDCRPFPPEDVCELALDTESPRTKWFFDDDRYCAPGPFLGCTDGSNDPNPGICWMDSTGLSFEMYVVADCGSEMHIPLYDVESGCISVLDPDGDLLIIRAYNGVDFDETGTEVCWNAEWCTFGQSPGGPGNNLVMDVSFQGSPTLCGVYTVRFTSWAGCIWELFANCDGTYSEQFLIHDDICAAEAALNPLPELIVHDLLLSDGGLCSVDYCVTTTNIGCETVGAHVVRVTNDNDTDEHVIDQLDPGASEQLCGNLEVVGVSPAVTTIVTATADTNDDLLECKESSNASACEPASGGDVIQEQTEVDCYLPPTCDAGGPYQAECTGADGDTTIQLDGSGCTDPRDLPLEYLWSTTCPDAQFDDPTAEQPLLSIPGLYCESCDVTLLVTNSVGLESTCGTEVTVTDSLPPEVEALLLPTEPLPPSSPASARTACSPPSSGAFQVWCSVTDQCDPDPELEAKLLVTNHDVTPDGECVERTDELEVDCGEVLEIHLVAPPCPTDPPAEPLPPATADSEGVQVIMGEAVLLELTATDACGNLATDTFDPTEEPEPPCDDPLPDGTCCPLLASPINPKCPDSACGMTP